MVTPINGETMRCFGDKMFAKCVSFAGILHPFGPGRQTFAGERVK